MSTIRLENPVSDIVLGPTGEANEYKLELTEKNGNITIIIFELDTAFDPQRYAKSNLHWILKDRGLELKITLKKVMLVQEFHF
jgi:hypothetical protein